MPPGTPRRFARWGAAVVLTVATACGGAQAAQASESTQPVKTVKLQLPAGFDPSEPHLAIDPGDSRRLFAVVQATSPENPFGQELMWRTADGGRTWSRSGVLGSIDNSADGASGDPVVAAAGAGRVLFGTLTFDFTSVPDAAVQYVGTRVSTDGGASFTDFGVADRGSIPLCFFDRSCPPGPPPPGITFLDKPWLAVDASSGRFRGNAYLIWVRTHLDDGSHDLLVATSKDGGRSYRKPIRLDGSTDAELNGLEELAQLVVRPDGTLDAVWNGLRGGVPVILHAWSTDGGRSFSPAEIVTPLRAEASRLGIVTSLAVSGQGRLGLCWSQARSPDVYDADVVCTVTEQRGRWGRARRLLPGSPDRQYLPAAAFQGERLWAAAYVSSPTSTRLVAGRMDDEFGSARTVNSWPVPAGRVCAPHPPDCLDGQTFIGDYIGLVTTARSVVVAYIEPSADPATTNRVLVSTIG